MSKPILLGKDGKTEPLVGTGAGQVATWSVSDQTWVPGPGIGTGGGGTVFYLDFLNTTGIGTLTGLPTNSASTPIAPPSLLGTAYSIGTGGGSIHSQDLTNGSQARVCGFVTAAGSPAATDIPAGLWDFNIWARSSATNGSDTSIQARVYIAKEDGSGYGSASGSSNTFPIGGTSATTGAVSDAVALYNGTNITQYSFSIVLPQTVLALTDRIYVELWAQKNVGPANQVYFYFGQTEPSHIHSTIPTLVDLATDVIGVLPTVNGGTGADLSSGDIGAIPYVNADTPATMALLASGSGDNGKFLKSNVNAPPSWDTPTIPQAYDLRGGFVGNPSSTFVIDTFVATRAFDIAENSAHKFYCSTPPASGQTVVLTIAKKAISDGTDTTIFTATFKDSATNPQANNGLYPATLAGIASVSLLPGDLVTVTVGTTNASFQSPLWTIYGTA